MALPFQRNLRAATGVALLLVLPLATAVKGAAERRLTRYDGAGIVTVAEDYLGAPYRAGGESPSGFDCSGFTSFVYSRAGYRLPRTAGDQYGAMHPVRVPAIGDLVFFRIEGQRISHVGIYVGGYRFIHAPSSGKKVDYADMRSGYWKQRYAGSRSIFGRP
ncbi:MAG: C40 family peptidase [Leptospirales bacterium]|nr:C40 family peptidase [Leptospirales bacterium]